MNCFDRMISMFQSFECANIDLDEVRDTLNSMFDMKSRMLTERPSLENLEKSIYIVLDAYYRFDMQRTKSDSAPIAMARRLVDEFPEHFNAAQLILATTVCSTHNIRNIQRTHSNYALHIFIKEEYLVPHKSLINKTVRDIIGSDV